jgi:hypothetical protein
MQVLQIHSLILLYDIFLYFIPIVIFVVSCNYFTGLNFKNSSFKSIRRQKGPGWGAGSSGRAEDTRKGCRR